jgi:hypothetical protein
VRAAAVLPPRARPSFHGADDGAGAPQPAAPAPGGLRRAGLARADDPAAAAWKAQAAASAPAEEAGGEYSAARLLALRAQQAFKFAGDGRG